MVLDRRLVVERMGNVVVHGLGQGLVKPKQAMPLLERIESVTRIPLPYGVYQDAADRSVWNESARSPETFALVIRALQRAREHRMPKDKLIELIQLTATVANLVPDQKDVQRILDDRASYAISQLVLDLEREAGQSKKSLLESAAMLVEHTGVLFPHAYNLYLRAGGVDLPAIPLHSLSGDPENRTLIALYDSPTALDAETLEHLIRLQVKPPKKPGKMIHCTMPKSLPCA